MSVVAPSLVPDYEVKLLLNPSGVLGSDNELKHEVLSAFAVSPNSKNMDIQFVDTKDRDIYKNGWNLRIRKTEDEKKLELTYKKRYLVADGDFTVAESNANIDTALRTAKLDGFDATTPYKAQVEIGYRKQTLSISHDAKISDKRVKDVGLPLKEDSRHLLADSAPKEFKVWSTAHLGSDFLSDTVVYGPVLAKRFKDDWDGFQLVIEVWPIQRSQDDATLEPIVEASFKTPDLENALTGRATLMKLLQDKGWFLAEDSLKTKLIMERYGETTWHL